MTLSFAWRTSFWRVQVKSVLAKTPSKAYYRVKTAVGGGTGNRLATYSPTEIDFLAAYIFQDDLWYVFPAAVIAGRSCVCLIPGSKRSKYEKYREAWKVMNSALADPETGPALESERDANSAVIPFMKAVAAAGT